MILNIPEVLYIHSHRMQSKTLHNL